MDNELARKLQGEIMTKAHQFKKELNIDFGTANRMAAKAVAEAHGLSSAVEMQREIGRLNWAVGKKDTGAKSKAKRVSSTTLQLAERLGELAMANNGLVPAYWKVAQMLETTPADLRHAADVLVSRGWTKTARSNGFQLSAPVLAPVAPATNGTGKPAEVVQGMLLEAQPDEVQLAILNELRQIRGLMAKMVGVWSK